MSKVKQKYQDRADLQIIGEPAIYPGHPVTIAYIIAHNFENWEDATRLTEHGYEEALTSCAIPGAGGRVSAALDLMESLKSGDISLEQFFKWADEVDSSEPYYNGRGSPEQAAKLKPWIQENLLNWLRQVDIEKHAM